MKIVLSNSILNNFELKNHEFLVDVKHYDDLSGIQEYYLYSYLSTFFNNIKILDIGTFDGRSAIALSHNDSNKVISYDIRDHINNANHKIYTKHNVEFKIKNVLDDLTIDFIKDVKIVMIDIDHFEVIEKLIIDKLYELNYSGIILLDDIIHPWPKEFECMQKLWNSINHKKYDITKYGHHSGTGIVLMNADIEIELEKEVIVSGTGGLGNCLFQIATAIYYVEEYNYKLILDDNSSHLRIGTSNYTNRFKTKISNSNLISYKDSIFNKLTYRNYIKKNYKEVFNNYTDNLIKPDNNDTTIEISGYCQNVNLFYEVKDKIFNYLNLLENDNIDYIMNKYNININEKNIMLGIRICDDFKHMNKINKNSYEKAVNTLVNEDEENYNIIIISDTKENYEYLLDFKIKGRIIFIDEDDLTQFNCGLLCNIFILSESTYHYWIALLKSFNDSNTKVLCFTNTDITNRNLALENWIHIDY
jgi:hypothetical protein